MKEKNIGFSSVRPQETCTDSKCPWHGSLPVRGRMIIGTVMAVRAPMTATVEWNYTRWLPKFERFERRHSHIVAYSPTCIGAKEGDTVKIAECRPLSKTKSFVIIERMGNK
ncbi:MAG: 30S ribosomal protein S17 [Candidatus Aenigmatarchaeota archaeon]